MGWNLNTQYNTRNYGHRGIAKVRMQTGPLKQKSFFLEAEKALLEN
jgi:hypothetical protein